jgi:hypothetical protein
MGVSEARQEAAARLGAERVDELPSKESVSRISARCKANRMMPRVDSRSRRLVVIQVARPQAGPLKVIAQRITLIDSRRATEAGRRSVVQ